MSASDRVAGEQMMADESHTADRQSIGAEHLREHEHHHEDRGHQDERECRGSRVVADREELRLDDVADHVLPWRPEQLRVDEVAGRRDEGQEHPGEDAGQRQRERDPRNAFAREA